MKLMALIASIMALMITELTHGADAEPTEILNTIFPAHVEEKLALSAAPEHLREGATVYLYGLNGYSKLRDGTNGFTCLLNRDAFMYGGKEFKPTCWDAIGRDTYVPVMLRVGFLLSKGSGIDSVRREIDNGFNKGEFHVPLTGGVAYMIAGDLQLDPTTGQVVQQAFPGHYMFYAVGASSNQLGTTRPASKLDPTLPSVFSGGAGGNQGLSYIIAVPGEAHLHTYAAED